MTTAPLPPLPEVGYLGDDASYGYDANDMTEYAFAARADLEAENKRLKDLLGKATALARIRFEHIRKLQGREVVEDNSDAHGPDWTDRESEYLK